MFDLMLFLVAFAIGFIYAEHRNRLLAKAEREKVLRGLDRLHDAIRQKMNDNIQKMV
jgi:cell division protein FtsL